MERTGEAEVKEGSNVPSAYPGDGSLKFHYPSSRVPQGGTKGGCFIPNLVSGKNGDDEGLNYS